jgi:HupE / UreJ protein
VSVLGLILFTACYFAIADRTQNELLRIALTFAFGLVHGFGFAGILQGLELPTDRLVPALAGFNLGVEIGQIGIVLLAWPALSLAGRLTAPRWKHWARDLATAGLCGLGCFWLLERAFSF